MTENDNNKGFASAFGGVVLIGLGIAGMNIPDVNMILPIIAIITGIFLVVKGLK